MKLKFMLKQYLEVNYGDLDKFLTERFSFDEEYEFVAAEEVGNDSKTSINVEPELSKWDREHIEKVLETKKWECCQTRILLCYLCEQGEIPAGEYLISVSW
ncbi:hypothetical protein LCGC14_1940680 [marine sediment metagenome]|uniref:Uncharacterized protein n=1 Tax=marine sediment metagenome TaxID=412755 RepID=A0A0F9FKD3_9ZZZZ